MLIKNLSIATLLSVLLTACVTINVYFPAAEAKEAADKIIDKVWGNEKEKDEQPSEKPKSDESSDESNNKSSEDEKAPSKENAESPESTDKSAGGELNDESKTPSEEKTTPDKSVNDRKDAPEKKSKSDESIDKSTDDKKLPAPEKEPSSAVPAWMMQTLNFLISPAQAGANLDISSPAIQELQARMSKRHQELVQYYNSGGIGLTNSALIVLRDPSKVNLRFRKKISDSVNEENADRLSLYREIAYANGYPEWESNIRDTFALRWIDRAMIGWWYQDEDGNWLRKQPQK